MKWELIDKLFREFDKDRKVIKKNLMMILDKIILEAKDEYGIARIIIEYKKNEK